MQKLDKHIDQLSLIVGRSLLGLYFVLPGLAKFSDWQTHINLMQRHGVPFTTPLLLIASLTNLVLGGALLANRYVWQMAYACAIYILVINFNLHDFWNFSGIEGQHETQNFVKNLGIFAGCPMLASYARRTAVRA
ncbi:MAG: DoxX family membrane protein [Parvularculales bacterium]